MKTKITKKQTQPARGHLHKLEWTLKTVAFILLLVTGFGFSGRGQTTLAHFGLNNNLNSDVDNVVGTPTAEQNSLAYSTSSPNCEGSRKMYANSNGDYLDIFINVTGFSSVEISWQQRDFSDSSFGNSSGRWNLYGDIDADGSFEFSKTDNSTTTVNCSTESVVLPVAFDNQSNIRIRLQMSNYSGTAVYIDDVTISGTELPACPTITPAISFTDVSCYGGADGTITIETVEVDGNPVSEPFYYSIDNGETYTPVAVEPPYTFDDLVANEVYEIRVMDSEGCESTDTQQ